MDYQILTLHHQQRRNSIACLACLPSYTSLADIKYDNTILHMNISDFVATVPQRFLSANKLRLFIRYVAFGA